MTFSTDSANLGVKKKSIQDAVIVRFGTAPQAVPLSAVSISVNDETWTSKQIKPEEVKLTYQGQTYSYTFNGKAKSYGKNKDIGKATITVEGKGFFKGTKTVSFKTVPKSNKVSKVAVGKRQMTVTWSKVSKAQKITQYQVRYREVGKTKWTTKTYASTATSATVTKLKKGKQYEVQVRSYKTVSKVKYYSTWSKTFKTSKIK
jgi:hypothetical protein